MTKKAFMIGCIGTIIAFVGMLLLVSMDGGALDLKVSQILCHLNQGSRYSTNGFGNFFETFGEVPMYLGALWVFASIIYVVKDRKSVIIRTVIGVISGLLMIWTGYLTCKNCEKYMLRHGVITAGNESLELMIGTFLAAIVILILFHWKPDPKAIMQFAIVTALTLAISQVMIHIVLKSLFSRERFRAIAYLSGDFSQFTPWYQINHMTSLPVNAISDDFRSFPSGHTASAGTLYLCMLIPFYFKDKITKRSQMLCYIIPAVWTGLVAVSRIVVGAHYFSDVLFGGTISFVCAWGIYLIQRGWFKEEFE